MSDLTPDDIRRMVTEIERQGLEMSDFELTVSTETAKSLRKEVEARSSHLGYEWDNIRSREFWDRRMPT